MLEKSLQKLVVKFAENVKNYKVNWKTGYQYETELYPKI
jgi:hypothetical protein